ncbi:MAG: LptE family protein [Candidatus Rokubacteria bacterium]|nr:LptE family protein [Candidatus Rokubacteria bacterium]
MIRRHPLVLATVIVLLAGCGYSLRGNLPEHIRTVAVPVFVNRTQEPAVENFLTRAVVDAFVTSGRLKVVRPEEADSILEGEIVGYQLDSLSFDSRANVREYRLTVTLNLQFRDVKRNVLLWRQEGVQEKADFRVPGQVSATITREESALRAAAVDIGRAIVNLAVDRF